ncbi:helix-turn-helix domain-containing protein [Geothrix limicola]|uniref:helix-turn-helix domain-containing protein n=1 Tax=Geothrix limicola TaxID=2927978 RepID=UPI003B75C6A1
MHPDRLNCELRIRGYSHRRIAEELGLTRGAVSTALRTGSSPALRELVGRLLTCDPRDIWPYRYPPTGTELEGKPDISKVPDTSIAES